MVSVVIAQQSESATQQQQSKKATVKVVSVDAANNAINVKDSAGADVTYSVTPQTKITKEGKTITLADIKADDTLSIEFEESGGKFTAKSVRVMPAKG
jgi:hypothetical protein